MCLELCFPFPSRTSQDTRDGGRGPLCGATRAPGQGWAPPQAGNVTLWASVSRLHQTRRGADLDQKIPRVYPAFPFCKSSSWWAPCPGAGCLSSRILFAHLQEAFLRPWEWELRVSSHHWAAALAPSRTGRGWVCKRFLSPCWRWAL